VPEHTGWVSSTAGRQHPAHPPRPAEGARDGVPIDHALKHLALHTQ
jgi:hypothetical protein